MQRSDHKDAARRDHEARQAMKRAEKERAKQTPEEQEADLFGRFGSEEDWLYPDRHAASERF